MSLIVNPCDNRKTWDARVRVTGGNPQLLWGIGEAETLTDESISVERITVDRGEQTIGFGQILVYTEDKHTVVDAKALHVKAPGELCNVLQALQNHARTEHGAAVLRVSPDTMASPELIADLKSAGYRRRDKIRKGQAGPRELVVRLGETENDLSQRLSESTFERCQAGCKVEGVQVRRVSANTQSLANVGLRTAHINDLLQAVGRDSVFLVVTEQADGQQQTALGYLWFVHTGESAMLYRLGFTDRAKQLGVDDALLLTGLVQLQKRRVHELLAGDPDSESTSVVLRELADEHREILGTWEYPLVSEYQLAGRAEKTRHKIFGHRPPKTKKKWRSKVLADQPARSDKQDPHGSESPAAAAHGVDADPDLARQPARTPQTERGKKPESEPLAAWGTKPKSAAQAGHESKPKPEPQTGQELQPEPEVQAGQESNPEPEPQATTAADTPAPSTQPREQESARTPTPAAAATASDAPAKPKKSLRFPKVSLPKVSVPERPAFMKKRDPDESSPIGEQTEHDSAETGSDHGRGETRGGKVRSFTRRVVDEGTAAIRDAARW